MAFHEIRFPASLSLGATGGPQRLTEIVALANGFEERNTPWAHSRRRFDAGVGLRSLDELEQVVAFFEARSGQLHGFRWKDWTDYKSAAHSRAVTAFDQVIGQGDDSTAIFQLAKRYRSGAAQYLRPVTKPVAGTVRIAISGAELTRGVDWDVVMSTGRVTFAAPPEPGAEITAGFEFDVPVRFDTDRIVTSASAFDAGEVPQVPVVEIRV